MNYAKLLEISSFFTWYIFLEVGKTQNMPSKIWQTLGDALTKSKICSNHYTQILASTCCKNKLNYCPIMDSIDSYNVVWRFLVVHMLLHVPCRYRPPSSFYERRRRSAWTVTRQPIQDCPYESQTIPAASFSNKAS